MLLGPFFDAKGHRLGSFCFLLLRKDKSQAWDDHVIWLSPDVKGYRLGSSCLQLVGSFSSASEVML